MESTINGVEIRPAGIDDVSLVYQFIHDLAEYENILDKLTATEANISDALFGERPCAEAVLAYYEGRPVGFAFFYTCISTFAGNPGIHLEDLFVKPECRSKGIGRALLVYLAQLVKEREYGRLEWTVLKWNEPAINFYKKLGAYPLDECDLYRLTGESLDQLALDK